MASDGIINSSNVKLQLSEEQEEKRKEENSSGLQCNDDKFKIIFGGTSSFDPGPKENKMLMLILLELLV